MIERVSITNFQSLKQTEVELGVLTVILGPNDLGKSAFFRAIRAAAEAQSGSNFITYGHSLTRVAFLVDGHELVWEKGASVNRYILDGLSYEKVGRSVPPDVSTLLGLDPVDFDKNLTLSLNFADQDDPPFLIPTPGGLSTSQVAKVLGDLTNLNVLYRAISEADTRRRRADSLMSVRQGDVQTVSSQLLTYEGTLKREQNLSALEQSWADINSLHDVYLRRSYIRNEREQLLRRHSAILEQQRDLGPDRSSEVDAVASVLDVRSRLIFWKNQLDKVVEKFRLSKSIFDAAQSSEAAAIAELDLLMESLDTCPLCDQPLTLEHVSHAAA